MRFGKHRSTHLQMHIRNSTEMQAFFEVAFRFFHFATALFGVLICCVNTCCYYHYCSFSLCIIGTVSTNASSDIPINVVVLAIGCIAAVIMIAIIIVAVLLVFFCIRSKKDNENFTDFEPVSWYMYTWTLVK